MAGTLINEGIKVEENKKCFLCGSEGHSLCAEMRDRIYKAPGTWEHRYCPNDGLLWLNPRPIPKEIDKLYGGYTYTHAPTLGKVNPSKYRNLRKVAKEGILSTYFGYKELQTFPKNILGYLLSLVIPIHERIGAQIMWLKGREKGRLLDIGCANGTFLARMRDLGWEVMGVEADKDAVRVSRTHYNLEVVEGAIEEANLPSDYFDAVTMNHVIEHVHDPVTCLQQGRKTLRPGGKLILLTPNYESLGNRIFQRNWIHRCHPSHLYIFSLRSLKECFKRAGLTPTVLKTLERYESVTRVWHASRLVSRVDIFPGGIPRHVPYHVRLEGTLFWLIGYLSAKITSCGEEIMAIAQKRRD